MNGLPKISQKAKPCNAGDYVGRYANSKKRRGRCRHPGARTPVVLLMPSTEPLVMAGHAASSFPRKNEKKNGSRTKVIAICIIALVVVTSLLGYFW